MKAKFQPTPSSVSPIQKWATDSPGQADRGADEQQRQAERDDPEHAEPHDQAAGDEARRVHAEHMPLDAERGVRDRMAAADHGDRRRGHHQVHDDVADDAAGDRGDEQRLPRDLRQRPAGILRAFLARHRRRRLELRQHEAGEHGQHRLRDEGRGEQMRHPPILGDDHDGGPDDAGHHAAGQHERDRLGLVGVARGVGRGEAVGIVRGGIEAAAERADQKQQERALQHRDAGDEAGERADHRAGLQARSGGRSCAPDSRAAACRATCRTP